MSNTADFVPGRDSFSPPITAFQILIKRAGGGGDGEPTSLSFTSTGLSIFLSSPLSTSSTDVGSEGVAGDGGDGDGDGNGTGIFFCLFFDTFAFLFNFFLGGYKIAEVGID